MNIRQCSAIAVVGAGLLFMPAAAQAMPVTQQAATSVAKNAAEASPVVDVRWRNRHWRGHHHRHWNRYGYYRGYRDYDGGALAAGAIFGLAAGALAANAAAGGNAVAYCSSRFRSYDPASGTYLGYDGYRHPCP
jgi:hypothetical protein